MAESASARRLELAHEWIQVIEFGSSFTAVCACGYCSSFALSRREALSGPCDVERTLASSADLLRHIVASSDERRTVLHG